MVASDGFSQRLLKSALAYIANVEDWAAPIIVKDVNGEFLYNTHVNISLINVDSYIGSIDFRLAELQRYHERMGKNGSFNFSYTVEKLDIPRISVHFTFDSSQAKLLSRFISEIRDISPD